MRSAPLRAAILSVSFAFAVSLSGSALADIPPPDGCSGAVGTTCHNAGPKADQAGVCKASKCPHATADGSVEISCVLCEPTSGKSDAGGGGAGGSSGSGGPDGGTGGTSSGGCALAAPAQDGLLAFAMLAIGACALAWQRRRTR